MIEELHCPKCHRLLGKISLTDLKEGSVTHYGFCRSSQCKREYAFTFHAKDYVAK